MTTKYLIGINLLKKKDFLNYSRPCSCSWNLSPFFIYNINKSTNREFQPHRWWNCWRARLDCGRSWVRVPIGSNKDHNISICCLSAKQAALRRKSKDCLAQNQDNVSEWANMSIRRINGGTPSDDKSSSGLWMII